MLVPDEPDPALEVPDAPGAAADPLVDDPALAAGEVKLEDMVLEPPPHPATVKMIAAHAHACITRKMLILGEREDVIGALAGDRKLLSPKLSTRMRISAPAVSLFTPRRFSSSVHAGCLK